MSSMRTSSGDTLPPRHPLDSSLNHCATRASARSLGRLIKRFAHFSFRALESGDVSNLVRSPYKMFRLDMTCYVSSSFRQMHYNLLMHRIQPVPLAVMHENRTGFVFALNWIA